MRRTSRVLKIIAIVFLSYVGVVVLFESLLGYFQPRIEKTLVITISDESGENSDRVLSRLNSNGELYVAVNHWPRTWYFDVLEHPNVLIDLGDGQNAYRAIRVEDKIEYRQVDQDNPLPFAFRVLTGFPPRIFIRLENQLENQ